MLNILETANECSSRHTPSQLGTEITDLLTVTMFQFFQRFLRLPVSDITKWEQRLQAITTRGLEDKLNQRMRSTDGIF